MSREKNIAEWSKLYGRQLSEEEYNEICQNLKNFCGILHKWEEKKRIQKHTRYIVDFLSKK
jgi:hypothetical protein